ncbi:MAG: hypothetical protein VYD19_00170 [Myxococcota bacterium]|nr:hypothetical protein [Myxococcota bacterium]
MPHPLERILPRSGDLRRRVVLAEIFGSPRGHRGWLPRGRSATVQPSSHGDTSIAPDAAPTEQESKQGEGRES